MTLSKMNPFASRNSDNAWDRRVFNTCCVSPVGHDERQKLRTQTNGFEGHDVDAGRDRDGTTITNNMMWMCHVTRVFQGTPRYSGTEPPGHPPCCPLTGSPDASAADFCSSGPDTALRTCNAPFGSSVIITIIII